MPNKQLPIPHASTPGSLATGTVTSVGMTGDGTVLNSSVTGSPITSSGTLVPSLKTQTANTVLAGPTSGSAAAPTFRALTSADFPTAPLYGAFPFLPNVAPKKLLATLANGDNDLYTVPANKKALIALNPSIWNTSGGARAAFAQYKIGGTYYRGNANIAPANNAGGPLGLANGLVLEAGQIFSVNSDGALYISGTVYEFDSTAAIKSSVLTTFASGDNTVYTVPVGKTAVLQYGNLFSGVANIGVLAVNNNTGGAITYTWNLVASGGSVATGNRIVTTSSVADKALSASQISFTLTAGDFVSVNTTSTGAQLAWVTVIEY